MSRTGRLCVIGRVGLDGGLASRFSVDLDAAWLGPLRDRDTQGEDTVVVAGLDVFGVERVSQEQLTGVRALGTFGNQPLVALLALPGPLRLDDQHVLLDRQIHRGWVDAGKIDV